MTNRVGFKVEGLAEVVRDLQQIGVDVADLKETFAAIADKGAQIAAAAAPRRSGRLAGSIRGNKAKSKAVVTAGRGAASLYAGPINYGWPARRIAPAGFMQRADQQLQGEAVRMLESGINDVIRKRGLL